MALSQKQLSMLTDYELVRLARSGTPEGLDARSVLYERHSPYALGYLHKHVGRLDIGSCFGTDERQELPLVVVHSAYTPTWRRWEPTGGREFRTYWTMVARSDLRAMIDQAKRRVIQSELVEPDVFDEHVHPNPPDFSDAVVGNEREDNQCRLLALLPEFDRMILLLIYGWCEGSYVAAAEELGVSEKTARQWRRRAARRLEIISSGRPCKGPIKDGYNEERDMKTRFLASNSPAASEVIRLLNWVERCALRAGV